MTGLAGKQRATEADVGSQEVGDENYDCLSSNFSNKVFTSFNLLAQQWL